MSRQAISSLSVGVSICLASTLIASTGHAQASSSCADPTAYGAIPNDGIDDGPAFRAALAAENHVCPGPGVWTLNLHSLASITIGQGQSVRGAGPSTVFDMTGSAQGATWYAFEVDGGTLEDATVTQEISNPDSADQNHLIQMGPGTGARISRVDLYALPGMDGGDCIRVLGNGADVIGARIDDVFGSCKRSGLGIQHGVSSLAVTNSVFTARTDQAIDFEPSSPGLVRLTLRGNTVLCQSGAICVTLSDTGDGNETVFDGNLVLGGTIQAVRAEGVAFTNNTVIGDTSTRATISIIRNSSGVRFLGNYVMRPAAAPAGSVVSFTQNNGGWPQEEVIANNRIIQASTGVALYFEGLQGSVVEGNTVTLEQAWSGGQAITCNSITASCDRNVFAHNVVDAGGTVTYGIYLGGWQAGSIPTGRNLVNGNDLNGFTHPVGCAGPFAGPVLIDDNMTDGASIVCTGATLGTNL